MRTFAILSLQGSFQLHQQAIENVGFQAKLVRQPNELKGADALIIPGGESTTMLKLMTPLSWQSAIIEFHKKNKLIFGTCAGMIILSKSTHLSPKYLGLIDIEVKRNAYGRQIESFTAIGSSPYIGFPKLKMTCIRAPEVISVNRKVKILATLEKRPMLLQQNNVIVSTFHPELSKNAEFYRWLTHLKDKE